MMHGDFAFDEQHLSLQPNVLVRLATDPTSILQENAAAVFVVVVVTVIGPVEVGTWSQIEVET